MQDLPAGGLAGAEVNLRQMWYLWRSWRRLMNLKKLFAGGQWVNAILLVFNVVNQASGYFPALQASPWFLAAQAAIGILLPSLGGKAHQLAYGTPPGAAASK
jgi:hypothetical protein